jgi:hypothetical protein
VQRSKSAISDSRSEPTCLLGKVDIGSCTGRAPADDELVEYIGGQLQVAGVLGFLPFRTRTTLEVLERPPLECDEIRTGEIRHRALASP